MKLLIVEDDDFKASRLKSFITNEYEKVQITISTNLVDAISAVDNDNFDIALIDMSIPSHPFKQGTGSPISFLNGGFDIIFELYYSKKNTFCIIITQYPEIEISGELFKTEGAEIIIKEKYKCDIAGCIQYSEDNDNWEIKLKEILGRYENINT
ncbi:response regulator [Aeromonas hydrophila]|uniref:response regulator n=1 Tax=Aeromonas hydrophila TaxID=644 RepID=UPI002B480C04|nr:response regulator [Aeromonas hydrophila]